MLYNAASALLVPLLTRSLGLVLKTDSKPVVFILDLLLK